MVSRIRLDLDTSNRRTGRLLVARSNREELEKMTEGEAIRIAMLIDAFASNDNILALQAPSKMNG